MNNEKVKDKREKGKGKNPVKYCPQAEFHRASKKSKKNEKEKFRVISCVSWEEMRSKPQVPSIKLRISTKTQAANNK